MPNRTHQSGFTLLELLLVLAIIGIITIIAIPALTGQRKRARMVGDADANARIISMGLADYQAENAQFGPVNATATWSPSASAPTLSGYTVNPAPKFNPQGNTQMTFVLAAQPTSYSITVYDGGISGTKLISMDQTGSKTVYSK